MLVIEAGTHHAADPLVDVPGVLIVPEFLYIHYNINLPSGYRGRTLANPKYDWAFSSVPQIRANNRQLYEPRGKGLGGSSMVHSFVRTVRLFN